MEGPQVVRAILRAHRDHAAFRPYEGVVIEPQTEYRGIVAATGYRGWRARSHRERANVGLFDVRVLVRGEPMEHQRSVIMPAVELLAPGMAEAVYTGEGPEAVEADSEQRFVLAVLQAAMAEQEVNWGHERFQCKTYFAPPSRRTYDGRVVSTRPRDLLMGYVRKCVEIRGAREWSPQVEAEVKEFLSSHREQRASRSSALMPKTKGKYVDPAWERFHEDVSGKAQPWLWGDLLDEFRRHAASAPPNPHYRPTREG